MAVKRYTVLVMLPMGDGAVIFHQFTIDALNKQLAETDALNKTAKLYKSSSAPVVIDSRELGATNG